MVFAEIVKFSLGKVDKKRTTHSVMSFYISNLRCLIKSTLLLFSNQIWGIILNVKQQGYFEDQERLKLKKMNHLLSEWEQHRYKADTLIYV